MNENNVQKHVEHLANIFQRAFDKDPLDGDEAQNMMAEYFSKEVGDIDKLDVFLALGDELKRRENLLEETENEGTTS